MEDIGVVRSRLEAFIAAGSGTDLEQRMAQTYVRELESVLGDVNNNPGDMAAANARDVLESIRDVFPQF